MRRASVGKWVSVKSLVPWKDNPRNNEHAVDGVAASIKAYGFGAPILARKADSMVIAGHTRLKAAIKLGMDKVPVRYMDITEDEAKALALADNKTGEVAEWNEAELAKVLKELTDNGNDLLATGFDQEEIDAYLATLSDVGGHSRGSGDGKERAKPPREILTIQDARLLLGDCLPHLEEMESDSIDSLVTDPPYGLSSTPDIREVLKHWLAGERYEHGGSGFMGNEWDSFVPGPDIWDEVFRVMKPGAYGVVFAGDRTIDLMTTALRISGFEIRHLGVWQYHSGMPKSMDVSLKFDQRANVERKDRVTTGYASNKVLAPTVGVVDRGSPVTDLAVQWDGWGTALKPALEPWVLIRKPVSESTTIDNIAKWGVGCLNVEACMLEPGDPMDVVPGTDHEKSRFPSNIVQCNKAQRPEREEGCGHLAPKSRGDMTGRDPDSAGANHGRSGKTMGGDIHNFHPTVKPLRLMAWLARLVTPPGGTVLDPFMGSGTTGAAAIPQGFKFVGCEMDPDHMLICEARIAHWIEEGLDDII